MKGAKRLGILHRRYCCVGTASHKMQAGHQKGVRKLTAPDKLKESRKEMTGLLSCLHGKGEEKIKMTSRSRKKPPKVPYFLAAGVSSKKDNGGKKESEETKTSDRTCGGIPKGKLFKEVRDPEGNEKKGQSMPDCAQEEGRRNLFRSTPERKSRNKKHKLKSGKKTSRSRPPRGLGGTEKSRIIEG